MATFLQICQDVARDSGTVPNVGATPSTVVGQTGRLLRVVNWVIDAWKDIQIDENNWRWMQEDFSGQTIASTQTYDSAAMSIADRFGHWVFDVEDNQNLFSCYLTADGQAEEGFLHVVPWREFRRKYMVGTAATQTGKPQYISVDNQDRLVIYPIPDAAYTIRGMYQKAPQTLAADVDLPEMPSQFHDAIKWRALILLGMFDEAFEQLPTWEVNYNRDMEKLKRHQLPRITLPGPLA